MIEIRSNRWTPREDDLFRRMAERNPPRTDSGKTDSIGSRCQGTLLHDRIPLKWFKLKAKGK
jgi:hypothetical protein